MLTGRPVRGEVPAKQRGTRIRVPVPVETPPFAALAQMREALLAALHSLSNNRLRSLLTTVGIIAGIASVIVLVALGDGMKANFDSQFSKLANQITVTPAQGAVPDGSVARNLTDTDVKAMQDRQHAPDISAISPAVVGSVTVTAGQAKDKATMVGATANYLEMLNRRLEAGTWFTDSQVTGGSATSSSASRHSACSTGPGWNRTACWTARSA